MPDSSTDSVNVSDREPAQSISSKPTPVRCFTGAFIAAPLTYGMYSLTMAIAHTFAEKPVPVGNALATKISVLVRTLVVGVTTMGTGIFAITTVGLVLLGLQLLFKKTPSNLPEG
ncbi:MAG: DUF3082 domain-containing protein [Cyanobacteria bacterium P01_E01_bin.6]